MIRRRTGVLGAMIIILGAICVSGASAGVSPHRPKAQLGSGKVLNFHWNAFVFRGKGAGGAKRTCLSIGLKPPSSPSPVEVPIADTSCRRIGSIPNLLGVVDELDRPKITLLVMGFEPRVRSVSLFFAGKVADRTLALPKLSSFKAAKAGVRPFRYGTFAFAGNSCLSRFVAHARGGNVLDDGGRMRCHTRGRAQ
jgi:hypothetical protein